MRPEDVKVGMRVRIDDVSARPPGYVCSMDRERDRVSVQMDGAGVWLGSMKCLRAIDAAEPNVALGDFVRCRRPDGRYEFGSVRSIVRKSGGATVGVAHETGLGVWNAENVEHCEPTPANACGDMLDMVAREHGVHRAAWERDEQIARLTAERDEARAMCERAMRVALETCDELRCAAHKWELHAQSLTHDVAFAKDTIERLRSQRAASALPCGVEVAIDDMDEP